MNNEQHAPKKGSLPQAPDIAFYHSADFDGKCSAAIIKRKFPNCQMIGIDYGDEFPWDIINEPLNIAMTTNITMVDFSLPMEDMFKLARGYGINLTWIDHHKSAISEFHAEARSMDYFKQTVLNDERAACELTWMYYHPGTVMPAFIELLGRYDRWDDGNKATWNNQILPFQYGLRMVPDTSPHAQIWEDLSNHCETRISLTEHGKTILRYRDQENSNYIKVHGFETTLMGYKAIALNRGLANSSFFDGVYNEQDYDIMIAFSWIKNRWKVSLYSTKECVDVSEIAKVFNGGGHAQAAGFICSTLPFKPVLTEMTGSINRSGD